MSIISLPGITTNSLSDAELARRQIANLLRYKNDPWAFLTECVYTLDQVDAENPIKLFPGHLEYLELFTRIWQKHKLIAVPKSRRMTMSWSCIGLYFHDTIFNQGRFNGFVSKKEDDAGDLISRAEFIYFHIPPEKIPRALLPVLKNGKMSKAPPIMEFEDINSKLQGFPMGADQLRQFTLSGLLGDECAFWPEAQKFYSSTKPTLDGGGRMTLISSRSPGFFKKIVFDRLDAPDLNFPERPPAEVKRPIPGIEIWQNPKNRFLVFDCHYSANPIKREKSWAQAVRASMPERDFLMEYEKSWSSHLGLPVYGDFSKIHHTSFAPLEPEPGIPLILGWDFGLTPAAIVCQPVGGSLRVLKEYIGNNEGILKFAPKVWSDLKINFRPWAEGEEHKIHNYIDPSGFARKDTDEKTCAGIMRQYFTNIAPGPVNWEPRKQAVEHFLLRFTKDGPGLQIDEANCPTLIEGFSGGYQYPESAIEIEPNQIRPVKNRYSHIHDAIQYAAHGAIGKLSQYKLDKLTEGLAAPTYSFQKRKA